MTPGSHHDRACCVVACQVELQAAHRPPRSPAHAIVDRWTGAFVANMMFVAKLGTSSTFAIGLSTLPLPRLSLTLCC